MLGVLAALLALAVGHTRLGNVHCTQSQPPISIVKTTSPSREIHVPLPQPDRSLSSQHPLRRALPWWRMSMCVRVDIRASFPPFPSLFVDHESAATQRSARSAILLFLKSNPAAGNNTQIAQQFIPIRTYPSWRLFVDFACRSVVTMNLSGPAGEVKFSRFAENVACVRVGQVHAKQFPLARQVWLRRGSASIPCDRAVTRDLGRISRLKPHTAGSSWLAPVGTCSHSRPKLPLSMYLHLPMPGLSLTDRSPSGCSYQPRFTKPPIDLARTSLSYLSSLFTLR